LDSESLAWWKRKLFGRVKKLPELQLHFVATAIPARQQIVIFSGLH
jgi:hypothetical protein